MPDGFITIKIKGILLWQIVNILEQMVYVEK